MAIRLTTERIAYRLRTLAIVVFAWMLMGLLVTFVGALSCATMDNRDAEIAGLKIAVDQREAEVNALKVHVEKLTVQVAGKIDESASPTTMAGDNATITNVSLGGSGVMALMLAGLLWRHHTAVGALDRVIEQIEVSCVSEQAGAEAVKGFTALKGHISLTGLIEANGKPDRLEVFLRSRLAKMEKP